MYNLLDRHMFTIGVAS